MIMIVYRWSDSNHGDLTANQQIPQKTPVYKSQIK